MARRSTAEGMELKAFAASIGKSPQWARKLKRENAPEWQAFVASKGAAGAAVPRPAPVQVYRSPLSDLERARQAKEMAWEMLCAASRAAKKGSDVLSEQVALNRAVKEARDVYEKACKATAAAEIQARQWVAVDKIAAMRGALRQLEDVVQNFEVTIAGNLPDEMRPAFQKAFEASRPAWNQGVKAVDNYLLTLLPVPC